MPGTPEAFYQEVGRAGRDGLPSRCTLLYDPNDQKLQRFFKAGRYPNDDDLVNAHHTLRRFAGAPIPPTLSELRAVSPLSPTRLRACLNLFIGRGIVRRDASNRFRLLRPDMDRDALARTGQSYRERRERDLIKLRQLTDYAETAACRWRTLLDYFEYDELADARCGHCDRCPHHSS